METGLLTNKQRQQLAAAISSRDMEMVALGYLDIDGAVIEGVRDEHFGKAEAVKAEACNTALLQRWANQPENSGPHQIKTLARLLYEAATENNSYMNAAMVENILGVTPEGVQSAGADALTSVTSYTAPPSGPGSH